MPQAGRFGEARFASTETANFAPKTPCRAFSGFPGGGGGGGHILTCSSLEGVLGGLNAKFGRSQNPH